MGPGSRKIRLAAMALALLLFSAPLAMGFSIPKLATVSGVIRPRERSSLTMQRAQLMKQGDHLIYRVEDFNRRCSRVPAGSGKAQWCAKHLGALKSEIQKHINLVNAFNRRAESAYNAAAVPPYMSDKEEARVGRELAREYEARYRRFKDPVVDAYLAGLTRRLARFSKRPKIAYRVRVLERGPLAFALPGGHIYLRRDFMRSLADESELAGVLAHEMGHLEARHHSRRFIMLAKSLGFGTAGGVLSGPVTGFGLLTRRYFDRMSALKFNRDEERQADRLAVDMLYRAGISPGGLAGVFDFLRQREAKGESAYKRLLSTHPMSAERLKSLQGLLADPRYGKIKRSQGGDFKRARSRL